MELLAGKTAQEILTKFLLCEATPSAHHCVFLLFTPPVKLAFVFSKYQHSLRSKSRLAHPQQCLEHVCICMVLIVNSCLNY